MVFLAGCAVETPTPSLIDPTGFVTYVHPTGVFSLSLPPEWIVNDTSDNRALNVTFSPPGEPDPLIGIYVIDLDLLTDTPLPETSAAYNNAAFEGVLEAYRAVHYSTSDLAYKELERSLQPDGSLRVKFLLDTPQGTTQHNDFIQVVKPYFIAMRVRIPDDPAQFRTVSRIVDTFTVSQEAGWRSASNDEQFAAGQDAVGFVNLNAWVDHSGGFVIVGQVKDQTDQALEFVRITAQLYDAENQLLAEQDDFVSSDMMLPGEFTPFSIVFSDGLPPGTVRYDLNASARYADLSTRNFYGFQNFAVSSEAEFDDNGFLVISGQVRNEGGQAARLVKVIVTIFDDNQRVIGTDTTLVDTQRLAPGETSSYSMIFVELGGVPGTFLVSAQGLAEE